MPREIVILSPVPSDVAILVEAGAAIDDQLGMRTLFSGAVHEFCRDTGDGDRAVLSVSQPLAVDNLDEIGRLLPGAVHLPLPLWWVEAVAPWGEAGRTGVQIAYELAARLGATCVVQDGE